MLQDQRRMLTVPKSHKKSKKKNTLHTCAHNQHRQPTEICHYTSDRASPTRPSSSREGSAGARDEATRTVREDVHRWSKYVARTAVEVEAPDGASSRRATAALAL